MSVTMADVRAHLDRDEVDYGEAQKLGPEAIPLLLQLVQGGHLGLASKAAYLASLIPSDQSLAVLKAAAASKEPVIRVAAASGARNLSDVAAEKVMDFLRDDQDAGVRKVMIRAVAGFRSAGLAAKVQEIAERDPEPFVRELAGSAVRQMK